MTQPFLRPAPRCGAALAGWTLVALLGAGPAGPVAAAPAARPAAAPAHDHDHGHEHEHQHPAGSATASRPEAAGAHRHGVGQLDIGLDGAQLQLTLSLPLDSLLGHERAPRTAAEREAARRAVQRLRAAADWLRPDAAAGCRLTTLTIEAPVLKAVLDEEGAGAPAGRDAAGATARPTTTNTATPTAAPATGPRTGLPPSSPAAQDEAHADLDLDAVWLCTAPQQLRAIEQRLFADHPRLQQLEVRIAGPRGQRQRTLQRPQTRIDGL